MRIHVVPWILESWVLVMRVSMVVWVTMWFDPGNRQTHQGAHSHQEETCISRIQRRQKLVWATGVKFIKISELELHLLIYAGKSLPDLIMAALSSQRWDQTLATRGQGRRRLWMTEARRTDRQGLSWLVNSLKTSPNKNNKCWNDEMLPTLHTSR